MTWETIRLGDAATFVNGYPFKPSDWSTEGKEIIRIQNLTGSTREINRFSGTIPEKYLVKKGDLLISWSATLGVYEWSGDDSWLNQHIFKVVFDKRDIDKRYFRFLIESKLHELERQVHGATMKHITKGKFDNIPIHLPPLAIQKQIADTLDKADALRQKDQQLLRKYDELAQSIFYEMFGNPVKNNSRAVPLSSVTIINPSKKELMFNADAEVSFVPMEIVTEDGYLKIPQIRKLRDVIKGFTYFKEGDVLFAKITPCMENGKGGIARNLTNGIGFGSTEFHVIRPTKNITSSFINALLRLPAVRKEAEKQMTGSAGQKRVPRTFFDTLMIEVPTPHKLSQFEMELEMVEAAKKKIRGADNYSTQLFNALLDTCFNQ